MNKDLYGKKVTIPEDVINYLDKCHKSANGASETTEGYKRNEDLRNKKEISYQQLKRIKNWFDNFEGNENDLPYILNGGHYVKNWVNKTLDSMRNDINLSKEIKSTVLPNQFKKDTGKINLSDMNRPSKSHRNPVDQYNIQVTENLKRINDLIKKLI
jgi:hypothetical protein